MPIAVNMTLKVPMLLRSSNSLSPEPRLSSCDHARADPAILPIETVNRFSDSTALIPNLIADSAMFFIPPTIATAEKAPPTAKSMFLTEPIEPANRSLAVAPRFENSSALSPRSCKRDCTSLRAVLTWPELAVSMNRTSLSIGCHSLLLGFSRFPLLLDVTAHDACRLKLIGSQLVQTFQQLKLDAISYPMRLGDKHAVLAELRVLGAMPAVGVVGTRLPCLVSGKIGQALAGPR